MQSHDPDTTKGPDESTDAEVEVQRRDEAQETPRGVRQHDALQGAERLSRLGTDEDKPADDRYGE